MASNLVPYNCYETMFLFSEPPSPPQNAEASQPSTTSVKLKWAAPKFDGNSRDPLLYLIDYNSSVHSEFVRSQTQTTSLSARIHGLSPYIEYQFRVIARNDLRESLPSFPSVSIQTLPDSKIPNYSCIMCL